MACQERFVKLKVSGRLANLMTSSMPLLEGLFLATVLDGRQGLLQLSFDAAVSADVDAALDQWRQQFPGELTLLE